MLTFIDHYYTTIDYLHRYRKQIPLPPPPPPPPPPQYFRKGTEPQTHSSHFYHLNRLTRSGHGREMHVNAYFRGSAIVRPAAGYTAALASHGCLAYYLYVYGRAYADWTRLHRGFITAAIYLSAGLYCKSAPDPSPSHSPSVTPSRSPTPSPTDTITTITTTRDELPAAMRTKFCGLCRAQCSHMP